MKNMPFIKNKKRKTFLWGVVFAVVLVFGMSYIPTQALTQFQVDSILNLLRSFDVEQEVVERVENVLVGGMVALADHQFERNLGPGSVGEDVKRLQEWLNKNGFKVAESGLGSLGNETTYFGDKTKQAIISYQFSRKIDPASGFFGPKTRAVLNSEIGTTEKKQTEETTKDPIKTSSNIIQSVTTDKKTYNPGDKIKLTIMAENSSSEDVVISFNTGCQFDYSVEGFRLMENVFCTQVLTEVTIPAGKYHAWETEHNLSIYPLESGWHEIEAGMVNEARAHKGGAVIGSKATVKVEIASDEPLKTSGNDFIYCLKEAGVVIYGTPTCPYCSQLALSFGGYDIIEPIYVDCQKEYARCTDEMQTRGVPEIQIKGVLYQESREPEVIGREAGCVM